jgi:hypothetical protein
VIRALAAALALASALPASAQSEEPFPPLQPETSPQLAPTPATPRYGSFQMSLETYRPNIDAEFGGRARPYDASFGGKRNLMFRIDAAYSLIANYGSLDLGFGAGYWEKYGHGFLPADLGGGPSSDPTSMRVIPTRVSLTYRYDMLSNQYRWLPLAPYARFAIDRYWWWVYNGSGNVANASGKSGSGATNGYSLTGGLAIDLGAIDTSLARQMDRDTGINHTYFFVEVTKSYVKDFGSSTSWDLSDDRSMSFAGGLLFVY